MFTEKCSILVANFKNYWSIKISKVHTNLRSSKNRAHVIFTLNNAEYKKMKGLLQRLIYSGKAQDGVRTFLARFWIGRWSSDLVKALAQVFTDHMNSIDYHIKWRS